MGSGAMKRFSVLLLLALLGVCVRAQERSSVGEASGKKEAPSGGKSAGSEEEARMQALEEQVRSLVEQVALLRGELSALRDAQAAEPRPAEHLLLASSHIEPGTLASVTTATSAVGVAPAAATDRKSVV